MGSSSRHPLARATATGLTAALLFFHATTLASERHSDRRWVGTWTVSPQPASAPLHISGQILR
jgi:hypothetical protein